MEQNKKIAAIILAAGEGKRIGTPKWKLMLGDKTFLELILAKLNIAGIKEIVCVSRASSVPKLKGIKYTINEKPEYGMISSIFYGVKTFSNFESYLIVPVDFPLFSTKTVVSLIEFNDGKSVVKPLFNGLAGHPILIPQKLASCVPNYEYAGGLKRLIIELSTDVKYVHVDDENVMLNINTEEVYKEALARYNFKQPNI